MWGYGIPSVRGGHAARKAQLGSLSKQPFGRGLYPLQCPQAGRCQARKNALVPVATVHVQADVGDAVLPTCWMESRSEDLWLQTPETESLWVCG